VSDVSAPVWRVGGGRELSLSDARLIGVVNITPDSFSDGGRYVEVEAAVAHALRLVEEGADVIDIGGESTRPGAARVPAAEQIALVVPVIEGVRRRSNALISIDTTRASVVEAAIDAGAAIINDVSAGMEDEEMIALAASRRCGFILMHRLRPPDEDQYSHEYAQPPEYADVVESVGAFLRERLAAFEAGGVRNEMMVVDPGLGFGKSVEDNYVLIARLGELAAAVGRPVVCAASRKSFIGAVSGEADPASRLAGSLAAAIAAYHMGVRLFRVHDVAAHRQGLAVARAVIDVEQETVRPG